MTDRMVTGSLYAMFYVGMLLLFREDMFRLQRGFAARHRLAAGAEHPQSMDPMKRHLHFLLGATMERPCSPGTFLAGCSALMCFLTLTAARSFHPLTALLIGGSGGAAPYLFLRLRLETRRRRGSAEGEKVISEFLRQYRICGRNVYEALERTIPQIRDCRICCRLLHRMLLRLRSTGSALEIREAAGVFSYAVGTNWSYMMAGCIRLAAEKGRDVSLGLEDILIQMGQARGRMEERKRLNSEAMRLTLFMVPLLYVSTAGLSVYYLEVPFPKFIQNQIGTPEGMLLLLFICFLFVLNLALIEAVNNQKLDY